MKAKPMDQQRIIMNFTVPPSAEDLEVLASSEIENLPEELLEFCEGLAVQVEEMADEALEQEQNLDDPFDLVALYRKGSEISPGVERKTANDDDMLIVFRRPLLDMWCEHGEDLGALMRQVLIEEVGREFDFSDDEIEEMNERHYQGYL